MRNRAARHCRTPADARRSKRGRAGYGHHRQAPPRAIRIGAPPDRYDEVRSATERARELLEGRVVWNVNSTARGGGVAEMLISLLAYAQGATSSSPDGGSGVIAARLAPGVPRLPVCRVHERERIQPDRCDAPQRSHQDPHADRVNRVILTVGLVAARAVNILNM